MKPLFTIHEGEFLVGDHINRKLGHRVEVWVPTKDTGIDLLVTPKRGRRKAIGLQVKFSRGFGVPEDLAHRVLTSSWFTLNPAKIRESRADLWVFVILTLRHAEHYVVIPTRSLRRLIPRDAGKTWHIYLWVCRDGECFEVRALSDDARRALVAGGRRVARHDYSKWLERWDLLSQ